MSAYAAGKSDQGQDDPFLKGASLADFGKRRGNKVYEQGLSWARLGDPHLEYSRGDSTPWLLSS